ncbi:Bug family tripartite tricarboxylate transporter substrate binding protein [Aureimonas populi]|uniref:Bug family tripartite tricarboxylate transporter substrate binding protein n=1 Tax=Aureimonas populi TaxID=1701758 RepID=A0ABW5CSH8_9HYPH|nr:tripartite tricarboxylate transporter substrate binding protein [Aureimonas populi]
MTLRPIGASGLSCLLATATFGSPALAQFPDQPIRIVVPFAAGGGVDALARPFAVRLAEILGQNVLIENQGSATGELGAVAVKMSEADGYTLLLSSAAFGTTPAFYPQAAYDPVEDFETIAILASAPQVLVATNELDAASVEDIIATARESDALTVALSATTGIQALATYLLADLSDIELTYVPYPGAGAAFPDLMAGRVDLMIDNPGSSLPLVQGNSLKLIATTGAERLEAAPDTPTIGETIPGFEVANWFVLAAPSDTPQDVLDALSQAAREAINHPELAERLQREGTTPFSLDQEESSAFVQSEVERWRETVSDLDLQVH